MQAMMRTSQSRSTPPAARQEMPAVAPFSNDTLDHATSLRRALRAIAADPARRDDRDAVAAATRHLVAAGRAELRDRRHAGASQQQSGLVWSRLVDAAVQESYRMARFQSGQRGIVAPLTVVAIGGYGDHELRPERPVQLLLLVPQDRRELSGRRMARHLTQNLRAAGLSVTTTVQAVRPGHAPAVTDPRLAAQLATGRLVAGSPTLWALHQNART